MKPPRKNQSPFALLCLIVFLLSGCIGDPTTVSPCEGANCTDPDAGHGDSEPDANGDSDEPDANGDSDVPDANGDSDVPDANGDSDVPDADGDSHDPGHACLVPSDYTLAGAVSDETCTEIYIESGHTETIAEADSPLLIQQDLLIYGGELEPNQRNTIEVSSEGLFEIDGGASLTLKNLEIRQLDDPALTSSVFTAQSGAELTLEEVAIIGLVLRNEPVIHAQNSTVHLIDSILRDTTSRGNGPVAIDCAQSSITLEDSAIESNTTRYFATHLEAGEPFYGAVALDNCDLTLTRSEIRGNRLRGDNISLNNDTTLVARGAGISGTNQSSVDILDESEVSDNEIFGHFTLEEPIDINIDAKGAGISLFDSSLTLERSTISENSINFSVSAAGENQGTDDSSIQALGAGLYLSFDEDENFEFLIDRSTISGNLIDFALEDAFAPRIVRGAGAGLAIFSHTPIPTAPLHMVNSTVSSNQISGVQGAEAAGILMKTSLEDTILNPEVGDLYAQIRYSTIAENIVGYAGNNDDSPGAGFVVHKMEASVRPLISLIGVLFQNNTNGSESADCGGGAGISQAPLLGSSHNLCSENSEDRCQDAFSTLSTTFSGPHPIEGGDAELSPLEQSSAWPSAVHIPSGSDALDAGQLAICSGINGASLTEDQRGLTRPINNQCDIGSVEVQ